MRNSPYADYSNRKNTKLNLPVYKSWGEMEKSEKESYKKEAEKKGARYSKDIPTE